MSETIGRRLQVIKGIFPWAIAYFKLAWKAQSTWMIAPDPAAKTRREKTLSLEEQIYGTPLWPELQRLNEEQERLCQLWDGE